MAKLVDALCSGRSAFTGVLVRIQFWAQRARVSAGLSVKEENILTLKLMLQRRTGSHSFLRVCAKRLLAMVFFRQLSIDC